MSRVARFIRPGTFQHVISRFVDRDWFLTSEVERSYYLLLLGRALQQSDWLCVAYCLMSNHLHLGMIAGLQSLESWTKRVNSPFANWLNKHRGRLGPIFADRPTTLEIPRERELVVLAYIHNNPVRAKLVECAGESTWSSHQAYVGRVPPPRWLAVETGLERVGYAGNRDGFDNAVRELVQTKLEEPDLKQVRSKARERGQLEIGTPCMGEPTEVPIVCAPYSQPMPSVATIIDAVAMKVGLPISTVKQRYARGHCAAAKCIAIQAASALGVPIATMATALNVSRQRGSLLARMVLTERHRALISEVVDSIGSTPSCSEG